MIINKSSICASDVLMATGLDGSQNWRCGDGEEFCCWRTRMVIKSKVNQLHKTAKLKPLDSNFNFLWTFPHGFSCGRFNGISNDDRRAEVWRLAEAISQKVCTKNSSASDEVRIGIRTIELSPGPGGYIYVTTWAGNIFSIKWTGKWVAKDWRNREGVVLVMVMVDTPGDQPASPYYLFITQHTRACIEPSRRFHNHGEGPY